MKHLAFIGLALALVACGGSSDATAPGGIPLPGHWCAALGDGYLAAMTLTQSGTALSGAEFDYFNLRNHTSTVSGSVSGRTVTLTFSNLEGYGPATLTGPAPGTSPQTGNSLTLTGTAGAQNFGIEWGSDPAGISICKGLYP